MGSIQMWLDSSLEEADLGANPSVNRLSRIRGTFYATLQFRIFRGSSACTARMLHPGPARMPSLTVESELARFACRLWFLGFDSHR